MKAKVKILIVVILLGLLMGLIILNDMIPTEANLTDNATCNTTFQLGDDMLVLPIYEGKLDCEDQAIFTYIYFRSFGYEDVTIRKKLFLIDKRLAFHVWINVTDNGTVYPYDGGICFKGFPQYEKSKEITYRQLLEKAKGDQ